MKTAKNESIPFIKKGNKGMNNIIKNKIKN